MRVTAVALPATIPKMEHPNEARMCRRDEVRSPRSAFNLPKTANKHGCTVFVYILRYYMGARILKFPVFFNFKY